MSHQRWVFRREFRRAKMLRPFLYRKIQKEMAQDKAVYDAIAATLVELGIPNDRGPNYEDEPSYQIMAAVLAALRHEEQ